MCAKGENRLSAIKSLQDLKQIRATASENEAAKKAAGNIQILVGMGTCGIAAGAEETIRVDLTY